MSWKMPSLWRRSISKETLYRRTHSTGGRSCWRYPAYARSTLPSSVSKLQCTVHLPPSVFARSTLPALPTKQTSFWNTLVSLSHVTPYTNIHSNIKVTHGSLDIHVCMYALIHTLTYDIVWKLIYLLSGIWTVKIISPKSTLGQFYSFLHCTYFSFFFCMWDTVWRHLLRKMLSGRWLFKTLL